MSASDDGRMVDLDSWDLGDVLGVVDEPRDFRVPERSWNKEGVVEAGLLAHHIAPVAGPAAWAVPLVVLAWKVGRAQAPPKAPRIALMAMDDATRLTDRGLLFFPQGGPAAGRVYARHPLRRRDYLPYANYHQLVLHEKSVEGARYLLALGACDVEITCDQSAGKQAKAKAGVEIPSVEDVSLTMGFGRDATGKLAIRITGAGKRRKPPADLIWPGQDHMFILAHDAALAGAHTFHFGLKAGQTGSVNAEAAVRIKNDLGLGLGGEYKRWEDLNFTVDATFPNRSS